MNVAGDVPGLPLTLWWTSFSSKICYNSLSLPRRVSMARTRLMVRSHSWPTKPFIPTGWVNWYQRNLGGLSTDLVHRMPPQVAV
ncbi:hypothetical protein Y032_0068g196 [Ancylostoma ceylanicum]|uniref:Uncharacterized protein n=1 Tax=Ancylostoma ceylanicum TaxID=53326 RepID=A0A016TZ84_9BILA|nr:hypothetical protein Y032_0068g196 [Ancylostoma ceylanicum]